MFTPPSTPIEQRGAARIAWWAGLLATLALVLGLGLARSAGAAPAPQPQLPFAAPAFADEEDECGADEPDCAESAGEECEWDEDEEAEECEEAEEEADAATCPLASAQPRVTISAPQRRLRLSVRYKLQAPVEVAVSLRASGGKGSLTIAAAKHRLGRSGSFQDTTALSAAETERALAAGEFTVRLRAIGVPWSCHRYDFRHLTVKRQGRGGAVFSESPADLRAGR